MTILDDAGNAGLKGDDPIVEDTDLKRTGYRSREGCSVSPCPGAARFRWSRTEMMKRVVRLGDRSTCGHPATGSPDVQVNGSGIARCGIDHAGGVIEGPGGLEVFANGYPVSLVGDGIASHGKAPHGAPRTLEASPDVVVGIAEEARRPGRGVHLTGAVTLIASTEPMRDDEREAAIGRLDGLRQKRRLPPLTRAQISAVMGLHPLDFMQFQATVDQLELLDEGIITPEQYMIGVLRAAEHITSNELPETGTLQQRRRQGGLFINLVNLSFSDKKSTPTADFVRSLLATAPEPAGVILEETAKRITTGNAAGGFNQGVADTTSRSSTVQHHFGGLLAAGSVNRGLAWGAQNRLDKWADNPGDYRNGAFALLLGSKLAEGEISVRDALNLTEWAYGANRGATWPASSGPKPGDELLGNLIYQYNRQNPGAPIRL